MKTLAVAASRRPTAHEGTIRPHERLGDRRRHVVVRSGWATQTGGSARASPAEPMRVVLAPAMAASAAS
jgi:hypothetical protein